MYHNLVEHEDIYKASLDITLYANILVFQECSQLALDYFESYNRTLISILVVEVLAEDRTRNRGALVLLEEPYLDEYLWFIPENSISYE